MITLAARKGVTLLEILISLTIMSLIFFAVQANFRGYIRRQTLASVASRVEEMIQKAKNLSQNAVKPASCNLPLDGYEVIWETDRVNLGAVCGNMESPVIVDSYIYTSGVQAATNGVNSVLFKVLGHGTNLISGTNCVVTLSHPNYNGQAEIRINETGTIILTRP